MESHYPGELGFRRGPQVNPPLTASCLWGLPPAEPWARETEPPPRGRGREVTLLKSWEQRNKIISITDPRFLIGNKKPSKT